MSRFNEYLESAIHMQHAKRTFKDFLGTLIGRLKGWKITFVDKYGGEAPKTVPFSVSAIKEAKVGDLIITDKDWDQVKAGEIISPHMIDDIDYEQRIITIKKNMNARMGGYTELNKKKKK